ncbi:type IV pilus modification PilV family protein [Serpentinicella alkaliphila]|uniref:Pilin/secretion family protein with methylation motif n=1 Tax=Serpentinicella alkaliphila TaxID=1734049 RepID=A0A4R2U592_9FIRM|nr:prepilin-type N-terminal cleavage/methylation domain-containing protein [Serpentinicella alkaliphila]QUH26656.1 prepilin-type N-terminal cleavage/methylation domain-containing protein [Serpentinicella alkaliphila]TCQ02873.1 pilin/secretion family protein with methylation motif [Serpentinicella alkaliphila]
MDSKGFTLISVIISLVIVSMLFTGSFQIFDASLKIMKNNNIQYEVARANQSVLEEFKAYVVAEINFEDFSLNPYSVDYISEIIIEPIEDESSLYMGLSSVRGFVGSMYMYRIFFINQILDNSFYYEELPITAEDLLINTNL